MSSLFFDIGIIVIVSSLLALAAHILRQPPIIAYIIAGLLLGPLWGVIRPSEALDVFSTMGIAFLLYLVGLNMKPRVLREVGKIALTAGIGQVAFTAAVGYFIVMALGLPFLEALYVSLALTFSSTIIVVKILSDMGDLDKLYGKVSLGILLVQDFISIALLVLVSSLKADVSLPVLATVTAGKTSLLLLVAFAAGRYVVPPVMSLIARSQELLFLSGIAWMFVFSATAFWMGLSIEIGAFLAGVSMASSPYAYDLGSRIRPLRDFFIVLFFIALGTQLTPGALGTVWREALILSFFVLIGNPLIVMILTGALGYRKHTGFLSGLTIAQISEFSLVLMALGASLGHVTLTSVTLVTMVGIITIAGSVYMMTNGERLFRVLSPYLGVFERRRLKETSPELRGKRYDIIVIGCDRMGNTLLSHLKHKKRKLVAIDFNPAVVSRLKSRGYNCLYGDASDAYILEGLKRFKAKLIVSTMPSFDESMALLKSFAGLKTSRPTIFVTAGDVKDALELYREGADYVIMPHFLGGEMAARMVSEVARGRGRSVQTLKKHHTQHLKNRLSKGL